MDLAVVGFMYDKSLSVIWPTLCCIKCLLFLPSSASRWQKNKKPT